MNASHLYSSWEAFKAYIRGQIICYTSSKTNKLKLELDLLEKEIKLAEEKAYLDTSYTIDHKLLKLRAQYNTLSITKAENSLIRRKQSFYEHGEKAGRLLAWQIKKKCTQKKPSIVFKL